MSKPRLLFLRSAIQLLHFTLKPGQRWLGFVKGHKRTSSRWQIGCLDPFKARTCYKGKEDMSDVFVTWQSKAPSSTSSRKCTGKPLGLGFVRSVCFTGGFCGSQKPTLCSQQSHRSPQKAVLGQRRKRCLTVQRGGRKLSVETACLGSGSISVLPNVSI